MSDFDDWLAHLAEGGGVLVVLAVAVLLGLRHATDPDHLTAVSTLVLSTERPRARSATALGVGWGLGHATTLVAFGLPVVLVRETLPAVVQTGAEVAVGVIIAALALRLLVRWRRGYLHAHPHAHGDLRHSHPHAHEHPHASHGTPPHDHRHAEELGRSPRTAYAIGLVHGVGGSAGVGVMLVGAAPSDGAAAVVALVLFALATALAMTVTSWAFGQALTRDTGTRRLERLTPVLGAASLIFGVWYTAGAAGALIPMG